MDLSCHLDAFAHIFLSVFIEYEYLAQTKDFVPLALSIQSLPLEGKRRRLKLVQNIREANQLIRCMKKTGVYSITQSLDHCDHVTRTALAGYPELAAVEVQRRKIEVRQRAYEVLIANTKRTLIDSLRG